MFPFWSLAPAVYAPLTPHLRCPPVARWVLLYFVRGTLAYALVWLALTQRWEYGARVCAVAVGTWVVALPGGTTWLLALTAGLMLRAPSTPAWPALEQHVRVALTVTVLPLTVWLLVRPCAGRTKPRGGCPRRAARLLWAVWVGGLLTDTLLASCATAPRVWWSLGWRGAAPRRKTRYSVGVGWCLMGLSVGWAGDVAWPHAAVTLLVGWALTRPEGSRWLPVLHHVWFLLPKSSWLADAAIASAMSAWGTPDCAPISVPTAGWYWAGLGSGLIGANDGGEALVFAVRLCVSWCCLHNHPLPFDGRIRGGYASTCQSPTQRNGPT
jgi:hypothetical protein